MHLEREVPDLIPVVPDDLRVGPLVLWRKLGDVVPLVVVTVGEVAGGLGLVSPEVTLGRIALVLQLLLDGEVEEGPAEGVLASDIFICEAVADDVEEAWRHTDLSNHASMEWGRGSAADRSC